METIKEFIKMLLLSRYYDNSVIFPAILVIVFIVVLVLALVFKNATYATIIAVAGFGISLLNMYSIYNHVHDIRCTQVSVGYDGGSLVAYYTFENLGTEPEIILGGTFLFPHGDSTYSTLAPSGSIHGALLPVMMEPFILKPKEIFLKKFEWKASYENLITIFHKKVGDEFRKPFVISIDFIHPKTRGKKSKMIDCSELQFFKTASAEAVRFNPYQNKIFD